MARAFAQILRRAAFALLLFLLFDASASAAKLPGPNTPNWNKCPAISDLRVARGACVGIVFPAADLEDGEALSFQGFGSTAHGVFFTAVPDHITVARYMAGVVEDCFWTCDHIGFGRERRASEMNRRADGSLVVTHACAGPHQPGPTRRAAARHKGAPPEAIVWVAPRRLSGDEPESALKRMKCFRVTPTDIAR